MPGDEQARAEFDAAYGSLVSIACHVVERFFRYDLAGIGEVIAETMARTYARWERVHRSPNSVAWVIACAKDVCLEQLRARSEIDADTTSSTHVSTRICDALDQLSHAQRDVAVLRFMMDCDEPTTAVALHLPVARMNTLAEKAQKRLGEVLTEAYAHADEAVA
jgi:DNA-directed RNA polymerase specialized sigma24 family protein